MIDLIIAYLALVVVVLLFIIAFLTLYIVYERRKSLSLPVMNDKSVVVPFLTLKASGGPGGDHSNSSALSSTNKRLSKQRVRHRPPTVFIRNQNSKGFLVSNGQLSSLPVPNKTKALAQDMNGHLRIHIDGGVNR